MLKKQKHRPIFTGGIEAKILKDWHVDLFKEVKAQRIYFAYDTPDDLEPLIRAATLFKNHEFGNNRILACYVLVGYPNDSFENATKRLETVKNLGFCPMAMLYRDFKGQTSLEWRKFQRLWARPVIIWGNKKEQNEHDRTSIFL